MSNIARTSITTDLRHAVRNTLADIGWKRGEALPCHLHGQPGYEIFVERFVALFERMGRKTQDQRSLTDQVIELRGLAIKAGLYDADDLLARFLEKGK